MEGREGIWESGGAERSVGFAGGQLAVKIGKVKTAGRRGRQEGGKRSCDDVCDVCSYQGHVRSQMQLRAECSCLI